MVYKDSKELAQENRSSVWALMIVGVAGLAAAILCLTGVLPVGKGNSFVFYGLAVLSLIFIIMGFVSLKNAKSYEKQAESEKFLEDTIMDWCRENLRAEEIDARLGIFGVVGEEELYLRRTEWLRDKINSQFINLDQNLIEHFIDETVYDAVFEQKAQR